MKKSKQLKKIKGFQYKGEALSLSLLRDGRLVLCGDRIVVYDKQKYRPNIIIEIIDKVIESACVLMNGHLACAVNKNILIWEINRNDCNNIKTLKGHTDTVCIIIKLKNGKLCSCSKDKTIKIWDDINYQCITTLSGQVKGVLSVKEVSDYLIFADTDKNLKIWDKNSFEYVETVPDFYFFVYNTLEKLKENTLIIGGVDEITILDILSSEEKSFKNHQFGFIRYICVLRNGTVLLGNAKGEITVYDYASNQIISTQLLHSKGVSCIIETEDNKIISSSFDNTVNIYEFG